MIRKTVSSQVEGLENLRRARAVLEDEDCEREALLKAAGEFWTATFDSDSWPVELQVKSLPARFGLIRDGSIEETLRHLDDEQLRRLCRELVEVADMADRLSC